MSKLKFRNKPLTEHDLDEIKSLYGDHPEFSTIGYSVREGTDEIVQTIDVANNVFIINVPNIVYDGRMYEKYLLFMSHYYLCEFTSTFTNEVLVNSYDETAPPAEILAILKEAVGQRETREDSYGDYCFAKKV